MKKGPHQIFYVLYAKRKKKYKKGGEKWGRWSEAAWRAMSFILLFVGTINNFDIFNGWTGKMRVHVTFRLTPIFFFVLIICLQR